ncbi:MAG: hypothetical protein JXB00_03710 [Bacteroidales bacterium]|nr:hypothetical protein [Bacteroidales bacterium]
MAKVTIYLSVVERDGKRHLHMRDSNRKCKDDSLVTEVSPGDLVVWKRDKCSGIKSVNRIEFQKDKDPFSKGVSKGWCMAWKGIVSKDAKGEYPYHVAYQACNTGETKPNMKSGKNGDDPPPPPVIRIK